MRVFTGAGAGAPDPEDAQTGSATSGTAPASQPGTWLMIGLEIVVESMFMSLPSLVYLLLVMLLLFYIYGELSLVWFALVPMACTAAVIGVLLFHTNDPR